MKHRLYNELINTFGHSCNLTEDECVLLQDSLELPEASIKTSKSIEKVNKKNQTIRFYSEGNHSSITIKQSYSNNDWNCSKLIITPEERELSGNVYAGNGVYYYNIESNQRLTIQFYDNDSMDLIRSIDDIELTAKNARLVLKLTKINPDKEITVETDDVMTRFIEFAKNPENICEIVQTSHVKRTSKKNT